MNEKQQTGRKGEQLAAEAYQARGYAVLQRNFTTRQGEIDLILEKDGVLVFCEVKTRKQGALVGPAEAVDQRKRSRMTLAAQRWLQQQCLSEPLMRFDVAEVVVAADRSHSINIIENAF